MSWVGLALIMLAAFARAADVALDIGHTLEAPGAISARRVTEYEFNHRLATVLADRLRQSGQSVRLINADGKAPSLLARTASAATDRLFVSIHHDSVKAHYRPVTDDRFQGFSLWVSEDNADYAGSVRCARSIADRLLASGFAPSHYHSHPVYGENRPVVDWERGVFSNRRLAVLRSARSAAVLIEGGVIAHPDEESRLADAQNRQRLAAALAEGITECMASSSVSTPTLKNSD